MPTVEYRRSLSPPAVLRSPSPDTKRRAREHGGSGATAGPSKKPKVTPQDSHRYHLEKLLSQPDKEMIIPTGPELRPIRTAADITLRNVAGSSAAAGSGEFHLYKNSRRREAERILRMELETKALAEQKEFFERQAEREAAAEAKTSKNRARRHKRKGKGGDGAGAGADVASKSKLSSGAAVIFKRPGERDDESGDEGGADGVNGPTPTASTVPAAMAAATTRGHDRPAASAPPAAPVAAVSITVLDEE